MEVVHSGNRIKNFFKSRILGVLVGAIFSGILLAVSMPPIGLSFVGWFALVPLFWAVSGTRFLYGVVGSLVTALSGALYLLFGVSRTFKGEPNWVYAGYLLFGLMLFVIAGTFAEMKVIRFRHIPLLAALAVCMESAMMVVLPVHIALSQYRNSGALVLASIGGIWAVSFLLWVTVFLLAKFARQPKTTSIPAIAWCAVMALFSNLVALPQAKPGSLTVGTVQTQSVELKTLAALTDKASRAGASIVVWPELSSISIAPGGNTSDLVELSKRPDEPAFVTTFEDAAKPKPHNVAALFWQGQESARYFKRKPFAGEATLHQAGDKAVVASWTTPIGLNICFDSTYPAVLRETANSPGVGLIALPTEDPPSANGVVQAIHSAYTPFRAAELGISIARADITGYSMIVGSDGRILAESGLKPDSILVTSVPPPRDTFYKQFGDWFLYLCYLSTFGWIGRRLIALRRRNGVRSQGDLDSDLAGHPMKCLKR
ncbi:MAG TPA: nitrilase-related carbon-nitrogen hydrolase [Fimbriimonadaceae bacterium]|jgi:apolipoprotein N-acyltransferase